MNDLQLIECVSGSAANKDYLQSLLAVGFYALALPPQLMPLAEELDFTHTRTQLLPLASEATAIAQQGSTIASLVAAHQAGKQRFYSAIKGYGGYLPTEKLLTYFQAQHIATGINLLAFESAYNEALALNSVSSM